MALFPYNTVEVYIPIIINILKFKIDIKNKNKNNITRIRTPSISKANAYLGCCLPEVEIERIGWIRLYVRKDNLKAGLKENILKK